MLLSAPLDTNKQEHLWYMLILLQPHELQPTRLLCQWDFPGKNTGLCCHCLLQGIFLTQKLNLYLCVSCIADGFFTTAPSGKSSFFKILEPKNGWIEERKACWEANRKEGQGSPNGGNRLQVSFFISLKRQKETNYRYFFPSLYKF